MPATGRARWATGHMNARCTRSSLRHLNFGVHLRPPLLLHAPAPARHPAGGLTSNLRCSTLVPWPDAQRKGCWRIMFPICPGRHRAHDRDHEGIGYGKPPRRGRWLKGIGADADGRWGSHVARQNDTVSYRRTPSGWTKGRAGEQRKQPWWGAPSESSTPRQARPGRQEGATRMNLNALVLPPAVGQQMPSLSPRSDLRALGGKRVIDGSSSPRAWPPQPRHRRLDPAWGAS